MKQLLSKSLLLAAFLSFFVLTGCQSDQNSIVSPYSEKSSGSVKSLSKTKLPAPDGLSVVVNGQNVTVSWNAVAQAQGYQVVYSDGAGIPSTKDVTGTSTTVTLSESGSYSVKVRALIAQDPEFNDSEFSESKLFTVVKPNAPVLKKTLAAPVVSSSVSYTAPAASAVTVSPNLLDPNNKTVPVTFSGSAFSGKGSVTFTWTPVEGASGYYVNGNQVPQSATSYTVSNADPGTVSISVVASGDPALYYDSQAGTGTALVAAGSVSYKLTDSYDGLNYTTNGSKGVALTILNGSGTLTLTGGSYSQVINLIATKYRGTTRVYTFTVISRNGAGAAVSSNATCTVHEKL